MEIILWLQEGDGMSVYIFGVQTLYPSPIFKKCIYFLLHWVLVAARGLALVVASEGYSLVVAHGLLTAVASPVAEHQFVNLGQVAVVHRLSCPVACGILLHQGLNLRPLHWQVDAQLLDHGEVHPRLAKKQPPGIEHLLCACFYDGLEEVVVDKTEMTFILRECLVLWEILTKRK